MIAMISDLDRERALVRELLDAQAELAGARKRGELVGQVRLRARVMDRRRALHEALRRTWQPRSATEVRAIEESLRRGAAHSGS